MGAGRLALVQKIRRLVLVEQILQPVSYTQLVLQTLYWLRISRLRGCCQPTFATVPAVVAYSEFTVNWSDYFLNTSGPFLTK